MWFFRIQVENLKKELELSNDSYQKMKKTYEEQLNNQLSKEKVRFLAFLKENGSRFCLVLYLLNFLAVKCLLYVLDYLLKC